jgi:uncharacterized membrane-anchored protein
MKIVTIAAFLVISLVQLFIPAKMIWDREMIIAANHLFKFKTAPVDPHDPFRGKYIYLQFQENEFRVKTAEEWAQNQEVFVMLGNDNEGYAKIIDVSHTPPEGTSDFVKAKVEYVYNGEEKKNNHSFSI